MSVFESLLNNDYAISRRARISDGQGGWIITYTELATVRGRLRPATGVEREVALQEQRQISHVLYVVAGTDIARGDQVEGADILVDVVGIREPSRADHHLEVDCLERQQEAAAEAGS